MPWATRKDIRRKNGAPVRYQFEGLPTKANLPSPGNLRVVPGTQRQPEPVKTPEIIEEKQSIIDTVKAEIGLTYRLPKYDRLIIENISKTKSTNPITRLEGRIWLRRYAPEELERVESEE